MKNGPIFKFNISIKETLKCTSNLLALADNEISSIGLVICQCGDIREEALYFCYEDVWELRLNHRVTKQSMIILRKEIEAIGGVEFFPIRSMSAYEIDEWLNYVKLYGW